LHFTAQTIAYPIIVSKKWALEQSSITCNQQNYQGRMWKNMNKLEHDVSSSILVSTCWIDALYPQKRNISSAYQSRNSGFEWLQYTEGGEKTNHDCPSSWCSSCCSILPCIKRKWFYQTTDHALLSTDSRARLNH